MSENFKIGLTSGTLVNIESMTGKIMVPSWDYQPYADEIKLVNGRTRGIGYPVVTWHWGFMRVEGYNYLKTTYCPGKSAALYINTPVSTTGVKLARLTYKTFACVLVWPSEPEKSGRNVIDVTFTFNALIEVV
jgi:hypothetical protein